jgi:hypothetical protein
MRFLDAILPLTMLVVAVVAAPRGDCAIAGVFGSLSLLGWWLRARRSGAPDRCCVEARAIQLPAGEQVARRRAGWPSSGGSDRWKREPP